MFVLKLYISYIEKYHTLNQKKMNNYKNIKKYDLTKQNSNDSVIN